MVDNWAWFIIVHPPMHGHIYGENDGELYMMGVL